jgi:hypothetical protein
MHQMARYAICMVHRATVDQMCLHVQPLSYNSIAWSQAGNGDPLLCVTGNVSQITIMNIRTKKIVTVCTFSRRCQRALTATDSDRSR